MAGGSFASATGDTHFESKITFAVIISCIMAATGGLMFGYDIGISGGVTSMPSFLKSFFPEVYRRTQEPAGDSNYCKYDNQSLQLFTSSLYLAALVATMFASPVTRKLGRKQTMFIAGVFFIVGTVLNAVVNSLILLILGRILLGCGVGFANQAVPVFLSEIAPTRIRGALNIMFQLNITIGILIANLVNYFTAKIKGGYGWRISLALAAVPAVMLTVGSLMVDDTPNSLIERGLEDEGKAVLKKIRGVENVEPEFQELLKASKVAKMVKHPFKSLLKRHTRPPLIIAIMLQIFQQFTGINAIMFYAPVLFNTLGFHSDASLYSAVITGAVNVLSTLVSVYFVDKVGRRMLLLEACVQMFVSQMVIAIVLGLKVQDHSDSLNQGYAVLVVVMVCTFVASFAWSWGPLGWLIPSETFPLETRSAGQSVTVFVNMLFTFIIAQAFLSMMCQLKFGIFLFFSAWVLAMSVFTVLLIPETKNIPIEEMTEKVWRNHWFWKSFTTSASDFEAKITPIVIISCIMAATGGLMFGYDVGVSGGVTSMPPFLKKFFPEVYKKTVEEKEVDSNYCKYDNEKLQLFTSCLYLAGLTATFFASYITRKQGRRATMLIAGFIFIAGVAFSAAAQNLAMLIIGRVLLGCGVGFANQAVPVFLSEIAPSRIRGALNILFQLNVTLGILFANLVNYGTNKIKGGWGWRLSLGLGGLPAVLLTLGAFLVVDTPNSLIERGHLEEGKVVLRKIRGVDNIEPEFLELVNASRVAKEVKHPFRNILKRRNRPQLIISIALQVFQQFTGINAIMFYAPVLFNTLGFKNDASLYSAVITGAVNVLSTVVSIYSADRLGRRMLLLEAGVQMFLSQFVIAVIIGKKVKDHSEDLSKGFAVLVVVMVCIFVSAFAWSWGPLSWLIPSEIFPLETRSAGQSVAVCVNLLSTFVIAQAFLSMLCLFKFGIFLFFSGCVLIMSTFVLFLLPETKNVPIEEMTERVWKHHWLWKRFIEDDCVKEEKVVTGN
ncbi:Sugar transport protein 13 [Spatholobus suberectus]|nr:Sugar transport protein 13 [Spatholobus suberectus]